jgi:magnesium-transporting ATPase (P-type)
MEPVAGSSNVNAPWLSNIVHALETKHWWLYWALVIGWIIFAANIIMSMVAAVVLLANMEAGNCGFNLTEPSRNIILTAGVSAMDMLTYILVAITIAVVITTAIGIRYYCHNREPARTLKHKIARWTLVILTIVPIGYIVWAIIDNPSANIFEIIGIGLFMIVWAIGKVLTFAGIISPIP